LSSERLRPVELLGEPSSPGDANVPRAVYVREVADARRRSMRRSRMVAEFGGALRVVLAAGDEAG
jgi:hypothetical protein